MRLIYFFLFLAIFTSCSSVKYYVVRHAEKEVPSAGTVMNTPNDPPLSATGKVRAIELREALKENNIRYIYSTNTIRTVSTAQPLNELKGETKIELYNSTDSLFFFIQKLKAIKGGNALIVGHSNTVDDIVNKLCGEIKIPKDLADSEYDNLFIVKKKGSRYKFESGKYGSISFNAN